MNNYMNKSDFAYPNREYKQMILTTGKNKRVLPYVYADTQRALRKTDAKEKSRKKIKNFQDR